jgi:acetylornithine/N-succinyldiaminopimelate aminotransferase
LLLIKAYHGSTQGALSIMGDEYWRNAFRPLLPDVYHFDYGSWEMIKAIDEYTACVFVEPIQAESGIVKPTVEWMTAIRQKCTQFGALMVADEIQSGFGRTGKLWAFEYFNIVPDILLLGKALGGGMPLGAFVANKNLMDAFTENPALGHITTFGGHPICCAAGKAAFEALLEEKMMEQVKAKEELLNSYLKHPNIKQLRTAGLWAAIEFNSFELNKKVIDYCIDKGIITDWFLFAPQCLRIAPPLSIDEEALNTVCEIILNSINEVCN